MGENKEVAEIARDGGITQLSEYSKVLLALGSFKCFSHSCHISLSFKFRPHVYSLSFSFSVPALHFFLSSLPTEMLGAKSL